MSEAGKSTLRRDLSVWGALGMSVALLGPSMAANINPQALASHVGRAVPLVFLISTVSVLLVAYAFVKLTAHFAHAGSVYGFVGATVGPRSGFIAGWLLLGAYAAFTVTTLAGSSLFFTTFIHETGIWPQMDWLLPAVLCVIALSILSSRSAQTATTVLLVVEVVTMILILTVALVVFWRIGTGNAPSDQHFTTSIFTLPSEAGISGALFAMTFGFLSFAGFEAAATLGEETKNPRRAIPIALIGTVVVAGLFFVFVTSAEVLGFGPDEDGIKDFIASGSLIGDLGTMFVGSWLGNLVTLGAAISAFGASLACAVGASRLLYAMGRDGFGHQRLGQTRERDGVPQAAVGAVLIFTVVILVLLRVLATSNVTNIFFWAATVGSLSLLVAYAMTLVGATRFLFFGKPRRVRLVEIVVPVLGLAVIAFVLYTNVYPVPDAPYNYFPYAVLGWIVLGVVIVAVKPSLATKLQERLTAMDADQPAVVVNEEAGR